MGDIFLVLPSAFIAIFVYVTLGFLFSRLKKRNDIADVMWGPGIFLVGFVGFWYSPATLNAELLMLSFAGIWALRLATRIYLKNRKKTEDRRYTELAASWGKSFALRSYLQVFLLQGFLMLLVGYVLLHAQTVDIRDGLPFVVIGAALWLVGFFFETVGDYQLDRFLKNPENKGRLMRYGLWKYSRHPNYFGEITMWWGMFVIALAAPWGFLTIISPLTITFLIMKVSGVPMLEKGLQNHPEFAEYKRTTSVLIPRAPKQ